MKAQDSHKACNYDSQIHCKLAGEAYHLRCNSDHDGLIDLDFRHLDS